MYNLDVCVVDLLHCMVMFVRVHSKRRSRVFVQILGNNISSHKNENCTPPNWEFFDFLTTDPPRRKRCLHRIQYDGSASRLKAPSGTRSRRVQPSHDPLHPHPRLQHGFAHPTSPIRQQSWSVFSGHQGTRITVLWQTLTRRKISLYLEFTIHRSHTTATAYCYVWPE